MIEKFAAVRGMLRSEFLDLNHTGKSIALVSLMIPKFARAQAARFGELRNRDTRVMIEKFAAIGGMVRRQCLDHTGKFMVPVSPMTPRFARDAGGEALANPRTGTLAHAY